MRCLRRQEPPTLGTAVHGPYSSCHKSGLSSQPSTAAVIPAQGQHIFSRRQMGEQGSKHAGHDCNCCGRPAWGCGHVPSEAGHGGRSIPQQGWLCCALCLAGPGRLSQGHIPVSWVMAAPLDVVLKKLPGRSMTKCNPKEQVKPCVP